jgi:hypothetical protein
MKLASAMLCVVALLCACGQSTTNDNPGTGGNGGDQPDLSAAAASDMAAATGADMQPAYGCHALEACVSACTSQTCLQTCQASATSKAKMLAQSLSRCLRTACYPHPDGGTAPCTNGGGTPSAACTQCLNDSVKMGGACYAASSACSADLP